MKIFENFNLSNLCSFGIGGAARYLVNIKTKDDLLEALELASNQGLPFFVLGGGSNVLLPDEGMNAVVLRMMNSQITLNSPQELALESGANWTQIMSFCKSNQIYGLETFSGLPGTIGGAIWGNAGCHGVETKDVLLEVEVFDTKLQKFKILKLDEIDFDYRKSSFKHLDSLVIWSCLLKVSNDPSHKTADPNELYQFRQDKQPQGLTTGSFFKNPPGYKAGQLIDQSGLKGFRIGNAQVSTKHANFFMNLGGASAADVMSLANEVQRVVEDKQGVCLEKEVLEIKANGQLG